MAKDNHDQFYNILLEIKEDIGEIKADVKATKAQAEKTNGRVTKLEDQVKTNSSFVDGLKGRIAIISVIVGIGVSLLTSWLRKNLSI